MLALPFIFPSNWLRQLAIYHSSGPWQSALKSFRQDERRHKPEKEKPTTPGTGLQPQRNPFTHKLTTPPLPLRQNKQVTILKLQKNTALPASRNVTAPHALPAAFLAHWHAGLGAAIYPLHNACSPPLRSRQAAS